MFEERDKRNEYRKRTFNDRKPVREYSGRSLMPFVPAAVYAALYLLLLARYTPERIDAASPVGPEKMLTILALLTVCFVLLSILIAYRLIQHVHADKGSKRSIIALLIFFCAALPIIGHVHDVASYCFFLFNYDLLASSKTRETKEWPTETAAVFWQDGKMGLAEEILFERDQTQTIDRNRLPVPDDVARLPDLTSRGYLYSLHQSMVRDRSGKLKELVERFVVETDLTARRDLLDRMVLIWSDVSDVGITQNTGQRAFLDKHFGEPTRPTVLVAWQQESIDAAYNAVTQYLYGLLLLQTHFRNLADSYPSSPDIDAAFEEIAEGYAADPERTKKMMADLFIAIRMADFFRSWAKDPIHIDSDILSKCDPELVDAYEACLLILQHRVGVFTVPRFGTKGDDVLNGSNIADILVGHEGDDTLRGYTRGDILIGGRGNDIYIWNPGDGDDTIIDANVDGESNVLRIGRGASRKRSSLETAGDDFVLTIGETGERITLRTTVPGSPAATIEFADET